MAWLLSTAIPRAIYVLWDTSESVLRLKEYLYDKKMREYWEYAISNRYIAYPGGDVANLDAYQGYSIMISNSYYLTITAILTVALLIFLLISELIHRKVVS